jgi:hypothetical protein
MNTINAIRAFWFTGWVGLFLYWLPLAMCAVGYTVRTWRNYQKDVKSRDEQEAAGKVWYVPTDTIGTLIGRAIAAVLPAVNLCAAAFDVGPKLFGDFFEWIGKVFDIPLVPQRKKVPS